MTDPGNAVLSRKIKLLDFACYGYFLFAIRFCCFCCCESEIAIFPLRKTRSLVSVCDLISCGDLDIDQIMLVWLLKAMGMIEESFNFSFYKLIK